MKLNKFEKIVLATNFSALMREEIEPGFNADHLRKLHIRLTEGLDHRVEDFQPGVFKNGHGAVNNLTAEIARSRRLIKPGASEASVASEAAFVMRRLAEIKPFNADITNGLVAKLFVNNLAQEAEFKIDWKSIDKHDLDEGIEKSLSGDYSSLENTIADSLKADTDTKIAPSEAALNNLQGRMENFKSDNAERQQATSSSRNRLII